MIARTARTAPASARSVLVIIPRDTAGDLPVWHPDPPRTGWTFEEVFEAAHSYATTTAFSVSDVRRVMKAAYVALMRALPTEVKRAEVEERLRGVDWRDTFTPLPQRDETTDLDDALF